MPCQVLAVADNRTAEVVLRSGAGQCFMAEEIEVDNLHAGVRACGGEGCSRAARAGKGHGDS